jgi:peroxiredoxin (alkyl hydroperoxide reductase subunit C)
MEIRIGDEAPDFEAQAYHQGDVKTLRLSQYRKQWAVLLFYPGDFTFV